MEVMPMGAKRLVAVTAARKAADRVKARKRARRLAGKAARRHNRPRR